jgi:RNA polymerase sigma factor (sigma-70 family)
MTPQCIGYRRTEQSDADLLAAFIARGDDSAFAILVRRYGSLVFQTARRIVHTQHDAEDVSQATFLALAQKARQVNEPEQLGGWLHRVATRLSLQLRRTNARRIAHEKNEAALRNHTRERKHTDSELSALIEHELANLPLKYRRPMILCYLDGLTRSDAAQALGCSVRNVVERLDNGRRLLAGRLRRRGVWITVPALLLLLQARSVSAAPPAPATPADGAPASDPVVPRPSARWFLPFGKVALLVAGLFVVVAAVPLLVAAAERAGIVHWHQPRLLETVPPQWVAVRLDEIIPIDFRAAPFELAGKKHDALVVEDGLLTLNEANQLTVRLRGSIRSLPETHLTTSVYAYDATGRLIARAYRQDTIDGKVDPSKSVPVTMTFQFSADESLRSVAWISLASRLPHTERISNRTIARSSQN